MSTCSHGSLLAGEQLAGSAPHAVGWLALEQSGPWGARAFTASHLDPALGREVEAVAAGHDVRPQLIRRPGRHADHRADPGTDTRRVLVAHTRPSATWLLEGTLRPEELLDLDWAGLRAGDRDAVRRSLPALRPSGLAQLLVCTNGTRDVCCAVEGRPVALRLAAAHPGRVWETTHTSGHRFAPTAALLPAGTLHGRLDASAAGELLRAADRGDTVLAGSRGRSTWPGPAQVAELAVREDIGETGLDALAVTGQQVDGDFERTVTIEHADGRGWAVLVESLPTDVVRAESCGKAAAPLRRYRTRVEALEGRRGRPSGPVR